MTIENEILSLEWQLREKKQHLLEIQARKASFVDPRNVSPDLDRAEQEIAAEVTRLEARLTQFIKRAQNNVAITKPIDGRELVHIPAGPFLMGSEDSPDEMPSREFLTREFWVDKFPVTNSDFEIFIRATGYDIHEDSRNHRFMRDSDHHPVVAVTWYDAQAYATWAGKRLLTEEEWEKSARGTDGRRFPWGNNFESTRCNTLEFRAGRATDVRQFPSGVSPYGVFDLAGNVWEWTSTTFASTLRVLRGGSWNDPSFVARCSARYYLGPSVRLAYVGFRCAWP